jgi:hypothetical protein
MRTTPITAKIASHMMVSTLVRRSGTSNGSHFPQKRVRASGQECKPSAAVDDQIKNNNQKDTDDCNAQRPPRLLWD